MNQDLKKTVKNVYKKLYTGENFPFFYLKKIKKNKLYFLYNLY